MHCSFSTTPLTNNLLLTTILACLQLDCVHFEANSHVSNMLIEQGARTRLAPFDLA